MKGGKVLGSGTAGCIFKPALLCKGETTRPENKVTKLMTKRNADNEYSEISALRPYISQVPNNEKYFVINSITKCVPESYTIEDLIDFNTKCKALKNNGVTAALLQNETTRGRIMGLQLPDGGKDVSDYLSNPTLTNEELVTFNKSMIDLMVNGIRPMNLTGVNHMDVKPPNIVYNKDLNETKLIDWGLASIYEGHVMTLRLPFMYNQPLTNVMFYNRKF